MSKFQVLRQAFLAARDGVTTQITASTTIPSTLSNTLPQVDQLLQDNKNAQQIPAEAVEIPHTLPAGFLPPPPPPGRSPLQRAGILPHGHLPPNIKFPGLYVSGLPGMTSAIAFPHPPPPPPPPTTKGATANSAATAVFTAPALTLPNQPLVLPLQSYLQQLGLSATATDAAITTAAQPLLPAGSLAPPPPPPPPHKASQPQQQQASDVAANSAVPPVNPTTTAPAPPTPPGKRQQQGTGAHGGRAFPSTVQLNKQIMAAYSAGELFDIVRSKGHLMDAFNISSAISRVPKLVTAAGIAGSTGTSARASTSGLPSLEADTAAAAVATHNQQPQQPQQQQQEQQEEASVATALADMLARLMVERSPTSFDARGLANSAWAFAKLRYTPLPVLPSLIASAASGKLADFGAQQLANLSWAFVYMHHRDERLMAAMADKVCARLAEFKPQELSNVLWAFASLDCPAPRMVQLASQRAAQTARQFKEQELSNTIWALGRLQHYDPPIFSALLSEAARKLHCFAPQGVSNVVWAMASVGHRDTQLLGAIVNHCGPNLAAFDAQALSNLAWGLATLGFRHPAFLSDLVHEASSRLDRLSPQNLSNILWACASMDVHKDDAASTQLLMGRWAEHVLGRLGAFEAQGLSNVAWAYARLAGPGAAGMPNGDGVFRALGVAAAQKLAGFSPQGLANTAWAFAAAGQHHEGLMDGICARVTAGGHALDSFHPRDCAGIMWALAKLDHPNSAAAFDALLGCIASSDAHTLEPQSLAHTLWACARSGHGHNAQHVANLAQHAPRLMPHMGPEELCGTALALASLLNQGQQHQAEALLVQEVFPQFCACLAQLPPRALSEEQLRMALEVQQCVQSIDSAGSPRPPTLPAYILKEAQARCVEVSATAMSTRARHSPFVHAHPDGLSSSKSEKSTVLGHGIALPDSLDLDSPIPAVTKYEQQSSHSSSSASTSSGSSSSVSSSAVSTEQLQLLHRDLRAAWEQTDSIGFAGQQQQQQQQRAAKLPAPQAAISGRPAKRAHQGFGAVRAYWLWPSLLGGGGSSGVGSGAMGIAGMGTAASLDSAHSLEEVVASEWLPRELCSMVGIDAQQQEQVQSEGLSTGNSTARLLLPISLDL